MTGSTAYGIEKPSRARQSGKEGLTSAEVLAAGRRRRRTRRITVTVSLLVLTVGLFALSLMAGQTWYTPGEVLRVLMGETVPGASFTVGDLRLPRASMALLAGGAFGMAGVTFQTMLRNPLASPDVIGISAGASAAAVFTIVLLGVSETMVSVVAIAAALGTAVAIYVLASVDGVVTARLILVGIGMAALLNSVVYYALQRANEWDLQVAMRWITGSVNGATWGEVLPLAVACLVAMRLLLSQGHQIGMLQLGEGLASSLGTRVERTRIVAIVLAVVLLAFATAAAGPIAFVAFLSGPIAARLVGGGAGLLAPSALVGASLVMAADLIGQFAFDTRYPVGVITGALGAPFLVYLLIRANRTGGSL